jgi:hypothetical protein
MSYLTAEKRPIVYSLDRATAESGSSREDLPRRGLDRQVLFESLCHRKIRDKTQPIHRIANRPRLSRPTCKAAEPQPKLPHGSRIGTVFLLFLRDTGLESGEPSQGGPVQLRPAARFYGNEPIV